MKNIPELNQTRADHIAALTVPCTYCGAKQYEPCINDITHQPLRHLPAHPKRIRAADESSPF